MIKSLLHKLNAAFWILLISISLLNFICGIGIVAAKFSSPQNRIHWMQGDDYLPLRLLPNRDHVLVNGFPASINSLGFRGKNIENKKNKILCLGDSVTFGWSASGDQGTYPHQLEKILNRPDTEVINSGVPRANSLHLLNTYLVKGAPLKPSLVLILEGWNDLLFQIAPAPQVSSAQIFWSQTFALVQFISMISKQIQNLIAAKTVLREREHVQVVIEWDRLKETEQSVQSLITLIKANGSTPILITLPHFLKSDMTFKEKERFITYLLGWPNLSYEGWHHLVKEYNQRIRKIAQESGVTLADCENQIPAEDFVDVCHLNDEGNRKLAQCVANTISNLKTP